MKKYIGNRPSKNFLVVRETFQGLDASYFSKIPFIHKMFNCLKTLIYRVYNISSNHFAMHSEFKFLCILKNNNGFPASLIYSQIKKLLHNNN